MGALNNSNPLGWQLVFLALVAQYAPLPANVWTNVLVNTICSAVDLSVQCSLSGSGWDPTGDLLSRLLTPG